MHALDNPIWHALSTVHTVFADGDRLARRYPDDIAPLAVLKSRHRRHMVLSANCWRKEILQFCFWIRRRACPKAGSWYAIFWWNKCFA